MPVEFSSPEFRRGKPEIFTRWLAMRADHPGLKIKSVRLAGNEVIATDAAGKVVVREHRDRRIAMERRLVELRAKQASLKAHELLRRAPRLAPLQVDPTAARRSGIASLLQATADLEAAVAYWKSFRPTDHLLPRR